MSAASAAPLPAHMPITPSRFKLHKTRHGSTIEVDDWKIRAEKRPILNGREIEAAEKRLGLPLPEMTFGNNSLTLTYSPGSASARHRDANGSSSSSGSPHRIASSSAVSLSWTALDALEQVGVGEGWEERVGGGVQVSMAETWARGRSSPSLLADGPLPTVPVKPHDWTYSTTFGGAVAGPSTFSTSNRHELPLKLLARQDPVLDQILFYDDISLFEDELHDNGESILNVRIRVMPHSFFILARLFLRVDNVLFRIHDVRVYHAFGSGEIVRESRGMEAGYDEVRANLEKPSDLSPLTNPNFVYAALSSQPLRSGPDGRPNLDRRPSNLKKGKAWPGLGRRIEVLQLPAPDGVGGVVDGVSTMRIR